MKYLLDDRSSTGTFPDWCATASRTTGVHLLLLARMHGVELATLDTGIQGALLIPGIVPVQTRKKGNP